MWWSSRTCLLDLKERGTKESGGLTYGYTNEERLEKGVIVRKALQDLPVVRDVDEYCQSTLRYWLRRTKSALAALISKGTHARHNP